MTKNPTTKPATSKLIPSKPSPSNGATPVGTLPDGRADLDTPPGVGVPSKPARPRRARLAPARRAERAARRLAGWSVPEVASAALALAEALAKVGDDYRPKKAGRPELAVGAVVSFRSRFAPVYGELGDLGALSVERFAGKLAVLRSSASGGLLTVPARHLRSAS